MREIRYIISEASKKVGVETYVLRNWQEELGLEIPRNELGHRYYREEDLELLMSVKSLKDKGFQLKAIRMLLPDLKRIVELENDRLFDLRDKLNELLGIGKEREDTTDSMLLKIESENADITEVVEFAKVEEPVEFFEENTDELQQINEEDAKIKDQIGPNISAYRDKSKVIDMTGVINMERAEIVEKGDDGLIRDKMTEFRTIMSSIMSDAVVQNNEALVKELNMVVSESVRKEVDYLLHLKEEREEERYKKLDRTIREYQLSRQQSAAVKEVEQKKRKKSKFFKKNKVRI